jgi:hypothetical protein
MRDMSQWAAHTATAKHRDALRIIQANAALEQVQLNKVITPLTFLLS